jgi:formylglycine-generating enzyme required for sulfatase activity
VQVRAVLPVAAPVSLPPANAWQPRAEGTGRPVRGAARPRALLIGACAGLAALALLAVILYGVTRTGTPRETAVVRPQGLQEGPPLPVKNITNSLGMRLVHVPAGKFLMGTGVADIERFKKEPFKGYALTGWEQNESPQHEVRLTKGFYLGAYEVTQGQYERVMGQNPSANKASPEHPVEWVTWEEAAAFCKKLSEVPEEKKAGRSYRLPTEAEWEYACRAGTNTAFHYGPSLSSRQANIHADQPFGTAEKGPRIAKTVKVGSYQPNAWGFYDMHGNVWEWCLDGPRTYTAKAVDDPRGPENAGADRVLRGGGSGMGACRSALRKARPPSGYRLTCCGLRVVCVVAEGASAGDAKPAGK